METTTAAGWRTASGPTKDDWNKHRPLIERLYRGLSLKKVMERMERHEGFKATFVSSDLKSNLGLPAVRTHF